MAMLLSLYVMFSITYMTYDRISAGKSDFFNHEQIIVTFCVWGHHVRRHHVAMNCSLPVRLMGIRVKEYAAGR